MPFWECQKFLRPVVNKYIRLRIRQRNRFHKKAEQKNCPNLWSHFRQARNEVIPIFRNAKEQYKEKLTSRILGKNILPAKWRRITKSISKLSHTHKPMPPLKSNGRMVLHPLEKAEALNNFYSNISSIDNNKTYLNMVATIEIFALLSRMCCIN